MAFQHGVQTKETITGARGVNEVRTGVIGLVGIAPTAFGKNQCILVQGDADAAQFGAQLPGFDIPQSLEHILNQNPGAILVVNVYDEATHAVQVTAEATTIVNGKAKTAFTPVNAVTILGSDNNPIAYVKGTDYTMDVYGNFKVIAGRIPNATALKFTYKKLDAAAVTSDYIKGTIDAGGNKTGMQSWLDAYSQFGFNPKILIAPGRSSTKTIADEMLSLAERLRAQVIIDSTYGASVSTAVSERGDASKAFGSSSMRAIPCYPYLKAYDPSKETGEADVDTNTDFPQSPFLAGVISRNHAVNGYWFSPSNKEILGVTGLERVVNSSFTDPNSDTNLLNGVGIVTIFNSFGTGYRTWGNYNASFPTDTTPKNFIAIVTILDTVLESMIFASLQFIDQPGTQATVDSVRETGNAYLRSLIGQGALMDGSKVVFDKSKNPTVDLQQGKYTFSITIMGPTPMQTIVYDYTIDPTLLNALK